MSKSVDRTNSSRLTSVVSGSCFLGIVVALLLTAEIKSFFSPLLSPMMVVGAERPAGSYTPTCLCVFSPQANSRPRTEARARVVLGNQKRVWNSNTRKTPALAKLQVWLRKYQFDDIDSKTRMDSTQPSR